jgi:hypothetical protein
MSSSVSAIIIAAVGVLGTLAAAIVSPMLTARARREDFTLQRMQREEEYAHQRRETERANKRSSYVGTMVSTRHYRLELINYLKLVRRKKVTSDVQEDLEEVRRTCLTSLVEVELVAPEPVRTTIDPVNECLGRAYSDIKNLEAGEPESDRSFEEINQSLEELLNQLRHMGDTMRHDLDTED